MPKSTKDQKYARLRIFLMGIKYLISAIFAFLPLIATGAYGYTIAALIELFLLALLSDLILQRRRVIAHIFNDVLIALFDLQMGVLFFGSTYISTVMISNLGSVEDLAGNAVTYISAIILVIVIAILPICPLGGKHRGGISRRISVILVAVGMEVLSITAMGTRYSPYGNYLILLNQEYEIYQMNRSVSESTQKNITDSADASVDESDVSSYADEFYSAEVADYREKDAALPEQPNVILIFTEGLSQNVIDDEREVMSNIAAFQEESLNFTGYYDHTFATYRGLIGQLYSGYQWNNLDENNLVSIQSIFSDNGYHTAFINTEPNNEEFTAYLERMGFDEVLGDAADETLGMADSYSDKQAYEYLWDTAESLSESDEPFFLSIYTFGTHASLGSPDEVFGDGSDDELNKFYNLDVWFGEFLEKFKESGLAENTILVFTADHATYWDSGFTNAFPDYVRNHTQIDEIPLCIYYAGIEPETIEVDGRNTLDLTPTILDYLDISGINYFLGESLFAEKSDDLSFDTIFYSESTIVNTEDGELSELSDKDKEWFKDIVYKYFVAKLSEEPDESADLSLYNALVGIQTTLSDDGQELEIICSPKDETKYSQYWFAVWSTGDEAQTDLAWYIALEHADGTWRVTVPLSNHTLHGGITIHVYGGNNGEMENLTMADTVVIP